MLKEIFCASCKRMGIEKLPCVLFRAGLCCVRFQIGGDEDIYLGDHRKPNGAYIENAVDRALQIYAQLPVAPDILRIDDCPGLSISGLPVPNERAGNSAYWWIEEEPVFLRKLFREIIKAEIDPTGIENLVSNVYFLNSRQDLLFQIYDDRDAYALAKNQNLLQSL